MCDWRWMAYCRRNSSVDSREVFNGSMLSIDFMSTKVYPSSGRIC